jgi:hypothetical protein
LRSRKKPQPTRIPNPTRGLLAELSMAEIPWPVLLHQQVIAASHSLVHDRSAE